MELETTIENKTDEIKSDNMKKLTPLILKYQPSHQIIFSSNDQHHIDLMKFALLNSLDKSSYALQFNKHFSFIKLEGGNILKIEMVGFQ